MKRFVTESRFLQAGSLNQTWLGGFLSEIHHALSKWAVKAGIVLSFMEK